MSDESAKKYLARFERMKGDRTTTDTLWQQVANYVLPKRDFLVQRTPGEQRTIRLYDMTASEANERIASVLHSLMTSTTVRWFNLYLENQRLMNMRNSRIWLDDSTQRMYTVFSSPSGNFASQAHELYLDACAFGMGVMFVDKKEDGSIRFRTRQLKDCFVSENDFGIIHSLYRDATMSAYDAILAFGDKTPEKIRKTFRENPKQPVKILHVVEPREMSSFGRKNTKKPWSSVYIYVDDQTVITESGFDQFPYVCPRFSKRSGEIYGWGPGCKALPIAKMLNQMMEVMLRSAAKIADPPILQPDDSIVAPFRLDPASIITYRGPNKPEPFITNVRPDIGVQMIELIRGQINQIFFVDQLGLPLQDRMTTQEVNIRQQTQFRQLGPILARMQTEFLGPLIDRVFALMQDSGMFLPVPQELRGADLKVEYISPIAIAQRSIDAEGILQTLGVVGQLAQIDPMVTQNVDTDMVTRLLANIYNFPAAGLRDMQEVKAMRQQAAEAAAQAQQAETAAQMSQAGKNVGSMAKSLSEAQPA